MHKLHKRGNHLIRTGVFITNVGVVLALLFGLSIGLKWWFQVSGVFALITGIGSLITFIGGMATIVVGLMHKRIAWGLRD